MIELFSLGKIFPSDFLKPDEEPHCQPVELKLMMTDDGLVRLEKSAPPSCMYGRYWYRSAINATMRNELEDIVRSIQKVIKLNEGDTFLDIACNDGTLLSFVPKSLFRIGIDPADASYSCESIKHANVIIQDYFSAGVFKRALGKGRAKVITSIAMFYDLEEPEKFIQDISEVLVDDGLWVMQLSYSPLMVYQMAFDNIVHEHLYYYSLFNLKAMLERNGFQVVDCLLNDINGGSFRVYIQKKGATFCSQPYRDVCHFRINSMLEYEKTLGLDKVETWKKFYENILDLKEKTVNFICGEKAKGKKIMGYGSSTKGNTLLQYFGLDHTLIDAIAERSPFKYGLRTVGTDIPIISEEEMRKAKPDYLLILPWHFISEFLEREKDLRAQGTKFIVPCPKFEII